jgi:hypothetical protein
MMCFGPFLVRKPRKLATNYDGLKIYGAYKKHTIAIVKESYNNMENFDVGRIEAN